MKKEYQLISIVALSFATIALLLLIFAKYYENDGVTMFDFIRQLKNKNIVEHSVEKEKTEENTKEQPEVISTELEETAPLEFVSSDKSYFDDALFISDSRGVGIAEYGTLDNATFFVMTGMSIHNLWEKEIVIEENEKTTLQGLLDENTYGKVYIMLGFNELGYDFDYSAKKYKETLDYIHEQEPNAIIYICSNLHVTGELSATDERYNNERINTYNEKLRMFADHETFFYLDINEKFDDASGNLNAEYSGDDVHLFAKHYKEWAEWLCQKTILK